MTGRDKGQTNNLWNIFHKFPPGVKTRDIAAQKAGFGNAKTYEQAKKVVEQAVIADQPKERQQEIAAMPPAEPFASATKWTRCSLGERANAIKIFITQRPATPADSRIARQ